MNRPGSSWAGDRRGIAAVEFALIAPTLLLLLGGVADFGLLMVGNGQLANGIAQGVHYALLTGPSVVGTGSGTATVQSVVKSAAALSGVKPAVTVTVTGPACYCVSPTSPATLTSAPSRLSGSYTCAGSCPSQAAAPGAFLIITASYAYQPLMPLYSKLANTTVSETVTVRLQ
jgi:Flp pilus assembly protein TadG